MRNYDKEIRELLQKNPAGLSVAEISRRLGVSEKIVWLVIRGVQP